MQEKKIIIDWHDPKSLTNNDWNSNIVSADNEIKLDRSVKEFGMFKPVLVRTLRDGTLQILGGEHRVESAIRNGQKKVPIVNLGEIDDVRAKEISLIDNGRYGADDALKLAELMGSLKGESLSEFLPFSDNEIDAIFSSIDINLDDLEIGETNPNDIPPDSCTSQREAQTHQIMRFKIPVQDAHLVTDRIEQIIKQQNFNDSDSLTNAGDALIHLCNMENN